MRKTSTQQFSPEVETARQRYFDALAAEQAAIEEASGIASRLEQVTTRISAATTEISNLEQQLKKVTAAITDGSADIEAADQINDALATAQRRLSGYQDLYRQIGEALQTARTKVADSQSFLVQMKRLLYGAVALELQAEVRPILQRVVMAYSQTLDGYTPRRRDQIIEFLTDGHTIADDRVAAAMLANINNTYLTPGVVEERG